MFYYLHSLFNAGHVGLLYVYLHKNCIMQIA